mgnify:CR=1 FL=1
MELEGKVALVTGGAVRIGRAICEALAAEGCDVVIHCRRSAAQARALAARLRRRGVRSWVVRLDLRGQRDCERLLRRAWSAAGGVDCLINNAAVFHKDALATTTERTLLAELRTNLFVPVLLTRAFAARGRRGQVVNLLDRRIATRDPACVPYMLSKQGLAEFTRLAALALAPRIAVNGVAPGAILPPPGTGGRRVRDRAGAVPLGRQVTPADVAAAVVTLLKMDAVTGQIMFVDGGQHLLGSGGTEA